MERDTRRDAGQWKGCHSFKGITCDGDSGMTARRNGGLKMGHTYYYYYELDGAAETHDPTLPSTNKCPYLPGQTVNTLWIPVEQSSRKRSALLNSLRDEDYMTMKPTDKFATPRPAPPVPSPLGLSSGASEVQQPIRPACTAPVLAHKRSARSLSPAAAGWTFSPRKLFSRKSSSSSLNKDSRGQSPTPTEENVRIPRSCGSEGGGGSRSRDISPESLRRFLVDDHLPEEDFQQPLTDRPAIAIPEDIVEENEDDDNFASSAVSESQAFTGLSPPPPQRSLSPSPASSSTIVSLSGAMASVPAAPTRPPPSVPVPEIAVESRFSFSSDSLSYSPQSPRSPGSNSLPSFYHSEDDDEEDLEDEEDTPANGFVPLSPVALASGSPVDSFAKSLTATLSAYSLPQSSNQSQQTGGGKLSLVVPSPKHSHSNTLGSPALVARGNGVDEVPQGNTSLLTSSPIPNSGLDDLMSELGWMADVIRGK